jgi:hypothetical protein
MSGVFISYRRQDSAGHTGRLFDRLQARVGRDRVFMDIAGISNRPDRGKFKDPHDIDSVHNFLTRHVSPAPEVRQNDNMTRTTLKAHGDMFVKLVTLEHHQ